MKIKELEELIKLVERSEIAELEITKFFGHKVRITKYLPQNPVPPGSSPVVEARVASSPEPPVEAPAKQLLSIRAPMVGTFYRAPAPDAPPYVEVGDTVKPGQVVCIIEAMKLMNEIEADAAGRIIEILIENESPVEFGQELFRIEPI
jgi:oxaloacetate decarboxylase alpha subunit